MKRLFPLYLLTLCVACAQNKSPKPVVAGANMASADSMPQKATAGKIDTTDFRSHEARGYQISTYDNPQFAPIAQHKEELKQLSDNGVFKTIHAKLVSTLIKKHQDYFRNKNSYELLSFAKGDLFQHEKDDYVFVIYDKERMRILDVVYDELKNKYSELYRDIKIKDLLKSADCNHNADLDYDLGGEIIYQAEYLVKNPESYLESPPCKITDLSKDETFIVKDGCLSKKVSKTNLKNSLCIATSSVYNNWKCLKYDSTKNEFYIYYAQAFAD
jgi:hypothetical protein